MRLGFALPQFGALADATQTARFATEVERQGAHSFWVGDRLLAAVDPTIGYGGGDTIPAEFRRVLDPFTILTVAATATTTARLGCNVLNLPWYAPAVLARTLTTIDIVSNGRLIPGFGIGWSPEEYRAAGIPWAGRGARLDESLDALEAIWAGSPAEYHGNLLELPNSHFDLRPVQTPGPPIYLGGVSEAANRRIGRRADGWLPVLRVPGPPAGPWLLRQRAVIEAAARAAGRSTDLPTVLRVNVAAGTAVADIVSAMRDTAEQTGINDMFVDLMYLAHDVAEAIDLATRLLAAN
jgi:probable F420-dependent oxidoreductase